MRFATVLLIAGATTSGTQTLLAQGRAFRFLEGTPVPTKVSVFADGSLRQGLGQKNGGPIPGGSLGISVVRPKFNLDFMINIAGNESDVRKDHAATLLAPGSGGSLAAGLIEARYRGKGPLGLRFYGGISSADWTDTTSSVTLGTVIGAVGVGPFINLFGGTIKTSDTSSTRVAGAFDIGIAWRGVGGDFAQEGTDMQRTNIFGSLSKPDFGLELGLTLQLNDLRAGFTYYYFGGNVRGMSKGQVVAGFSISSALLSGELK
jgi:hypothetical protein